MERAVVTAHATPDAGRVAVKAMARGKDVEARIAAPEQERAGDAAGRVRAKVPEAERSDLSRCEMRNHKN